MWFKKHPDWHFIFYFKVHNFKENMCRVKQLLYEVMTYRRLVKSMLILDTFWSNVYWWKTRLWKCGIPYTHPYDFLTFAEMEISRVRLTAKEYIKWNTTQLCTMWKEDWWVSLFKCHINLQRLFNSKAIIVEKQQWYYLLLRWGDLVVHKFLKSISLKVKIIVTMKLELI